MESSSPTKGDDPWLTPRPPAAVVLPDVFVHISAVERAGMSNLNEDRKHSFDVQADPRSGKSAAADLPAV